MTPMPGDDDPADDADERRLFQDAVRGVRPLRHHPPAPRPPRAVPYARFTRADRAAVLRESLDGVHADPELASGEELVFLRPQVQPAVLRKLRRGEFRVQREIDLHGLTVAQAKAALREFLVEAIEARVRCVRIIHGKGTGTLRRTVHAVLGRLPDVASFRLADATHHLR